MMALKFGRFVIYLGICLSACAFAMSAVAYSGKEIPGFIAYVFYGLAALFLLGGAVAITRAGIKEDKG